MEQTVNSKKYIKLLIILFLLISLPIALLLSRQRQEIRKKAASTANLVFTNDSPSVGSSVTATLKLTSSAAWVYGKMILPPTVTASTPLVADPGNKVLFNGGLLSSDAAGYKTYELTAGAKSASNLLTGNLFSVPFTPNSGTEGSTITVLYQLVIVDINGGTTTAGTQATFIVQGAATATPAPGTEPTNSVSVGTVEPVMTGTTTTGYKVRVTVTGNPAPLKTFGGETSACAVKLLGALPIASEADIKSTLAGSGDVCLNDNITTYDFVFSSGAYGQQRKIWATFHNDSTTTASNYWPNTAWSIPQSSAIVNVPLLPTPIATLLPGVPDGSKWDQFIPLRITTFDSSYNLWPLATPDAVINEFDFVRWLDLGGSF